MMSVKTLLKLNKLFRCPAHPFNAPAEKTQQGPDPAYARWEYGRAEAGLLLFAPWYAPGDIVFLSSNVDPGGFEAALCTDTGTLLMRSSAGTTIRLREFTADSDITSRIVSVRRVFSD